MYVTTFYSFKGGVGRTMALDAGFHTPHAYLARAHRRDSAGDAAGASQDALAALRAIRSSENDAEGPGLGRLEILEMLTAATGFLPGDDRKLDLAAFDSLFGTSLAQRDVEDE